jgi:thiosulfate/3-mercaptopyruvate sulfurtransferase
VAVLDGGWKKWTAEGRPVEQGRRSPSAGRFTATLDRARVRDVDAMLANVTHAAEQVVDARSAGRFTAAEPEPRAGMRGGHIPGSRSLHYASLVNPDGTLRAQDDLRALVRDAGLDLERPIVASCGSGVSACAVVLALETLGARHTAVYDGSWSEWGGRPDTPIETGPPA